MHINTVTGSKRDRLHSQKNAKREVASESISLVSKYGMMEKEEPALSVSLPVRE